MVAKLMYLVATWIKDMSLDRCTKSQYQGLSDERDYRLSLFQEKEKFFMNKQK